MENRTRKNCAFDSNTLQLLFVDHYSGDHFMHDTVEHYKNYYSVDYYSGDHCMITNCSVGHDTVEKYLKIKYSVSIFIIICKIAT